MEYSEIIQEIENLKSDEFTMDTLRYVGIINQKVNEVFSLASQKKKPDATDHYFIVKEYLNSKVYDILKEKLKFDDEIIQKIVKLLNFADRFEEIYILDGNIVVKMTTPENGDISFLVPTNNFNDITTIFFDENVFDKQLDNMEFKEKLVGRLNALVRIVLKDKVFSTDFIRIEDGIISYSIPNLNIYLNHSLEEIKNDQSKLTTKVLIKYDDELYYFDMKKNNENIVFANNNYITNKVSEMLDVKKKVKKR